MFEWRNMFKGMVMGLTDLIPGVSGGTIAVILGFYERLVASLRGLLTREWLKHVGFLFPLGIGMLFSLFVFSGVIEWLLFHYPEPTFYFFIGLIAGIIPRLLKDIDFKQSFRFNHYGVLILSALLIASTAFFREDSTGMIMSSITWKEYIYLFVAGWLGSTALILPGISGSFVLLLLGVYPTVIHALSDRHLGIIMVVGLGVMIGLLLTSRLIHFLLQRYRAGTYAFMIGMVGGSIFVIFPGIVRDVPLLVLCMITLLLGFICSIWIGRYRSTSA